MTSTASRGGKDLHAQEAREFRRRIRALSPGKLRLLALELRERLEELEERAREPIAIVGMACRFPGNADDPESYWRLLAEGVDAIRETPAERWDSGFYFDPDPEAPGKVYTRWGGFLEGIDRFDPEFFGIPPREAVTMDPQQRIFLEVAWEALENAAIVPDRLAGSQAGVFVGIGPTEYPPLHALQRETIDSYTCTGNAHSIVANRLSYLLDLRGPSMAIDTACSSSLVAIHLACQSLRRGETELALAGGVYLLLSPLLTISLCKAHLMAPDGRCKTFDARADGYVRGEGCGVVVLKPLSVARRDGDRLLGVIRGSAVNQDGRSNGLTSPNMLAQQDVMRQALRDARLRPEDVSFVEAHGTGTAVGDVIELEALKEVYGAPREDGGRCHVGSVKTNIGHLEPAAGIAGLMKVLLGFQHQVIPRNLHFRELNREVSLADTPLAIAAEAVAWPRGGRRAGISSYGLGGTSAHLLVEEPPAEDPIGPRRSPAEILCLSARSAEALEKLIHRYVQHLAEGPELDLGDLCYTANVGRRHFAHRMSVVAADLEALKQRLSSAAAGLEIRGVSRGRAAARPRIAFLFTGQGSQYPGMGHQLYDTQPVFRRALERCEEILRPLIDRPLRQVLFDRPGDGEEGPPAIDRTLYTQPALFALEVALAELWRSWGVEPDAVIGHSVGEYSAACVAGVFDLESGLRLIAERARLMQDLPAGGTMAAVFTDQERVVEAIAPRRADLSVAAINARREIVISGRRETLESVLEELAEQGVKSRSLPVSHAFHSPLVEPVVEPFAAVAGSVSYASPRIALISNVTGDWATEEVARADYWQRHLREPVRFAAGIDALRAKDFTILLEIGPQPALLALARKGCPDASSLWLPSLRKGRPDREQMLDSLGQLYCRGVEVRWQDFYEDAPRTRVALPTYPFERRRFWLEAVDQKLDPQRLAPPADDGRRHPLLGRRLTLPLSDQLRFENELGPDSPGFFADHVLYDQVVFPAAGYLAMAIAAGQEAVGVRGGRLEGFRFLEVLRFAERQPRRAQLILTPTSEGHYRFEVVSTEATGDPQTAGWSVHSRGILAGSLPDEALADPPDLEVLRNRMSKGLPGDELYERVALYGYAYGPAFRRIERVFRGDGEALARLRLVDTEKDGGAVFSAGLLDACFQLFSQSSEDWEALLEGGEGMHVPFSVGGLRWRDLPADGPLWCYVRRTAGARSVGGKDLHGQVFLFSERRTVAELEGVELRWVPRELLVGTRAHEDARQVFHEIVWRPRPLGSLRLFEERERRGRWLIFGDRGGVGRRLGERLAEWGERPQIVSAGSSFSGSSPEGWTVDPACPEDFERLLQEAGTAAPGPLRGIVHLWTLDVEEPEPADDLDWSSADQLVSCGSVLHAIQAVEQASAQARGNDAGTYLWLVTRGSQSTQGEPPAIAQAPVWGLGRVIARELPHLRCRRIDLDPGATEEESARRLSDEIQSDDREDQVAWRGDERRIARLVPYGDSASDGPRLDLPGEEPFFLAIPQRGTFENLAIRPATRRPPGPGEVEIRVHATGLNFRDVLNVLGEYPGDPGPLGGECAGEVCAIGTGVEDFRIGDRVIAFAPQSFASHLTVSAMSVAPMPESSSFDEAATIPVAFLTAYYGLRRLARLSAGERVLIHAAAGGVGMAAIQIALRAGAEVLATASRPKWQLLRALGVEHVMDSRSLGFADQVMEATGGAGVDVVLNSLSGDFIARSFDVLADGGRFVEIGKRGIWTPERVARLDKKISYFPFDLIEESHRDPDLIHSMLSQLVAAVEEGSLRPLPRKVFPLERAPSAFRFMAQAKHVGKIVVAQSVSRDSGKVFAADAAYLITGGLGALGLRVARWLIERGARHLVLMGRSRPGKATREFLKDLEEIGGQMTVAQGDAARAADVRRILDHITGALPPLRGVVHAAGVLDDGVLAQQTWERFSAVLQPKVDGAWNLHALTVRQPLDFFVLFSSAAGVLGSPGQGNYAAANSFLDALAHYRRARGLAALTLDWGPWADAGMASGVDQERWRSQGVEPIATADGLRWLENLVGERETVPQIAVLPVRWTTYLRRFPAGAEPPLFEELTQTEAATESEAGSPRLLQRLAEASGSERREMLAEHIREQSNRILGFDPSHPLDSAQPLKELGLDSLMAVELRNTLQQQLGTQRTTNLLTTSVSIEELAEQLSQELAAEEPALT